MLILKDEHAIDVLKSGNTGHLWHDFHAIGVHATDVGHPKVSSPSSLRVLFSFLFVLVVFSLSYFINTNILPVIHVSSVSTNK